MKKIHWLGTGLSSIPGLKTLISNGFSVFVYNRTLKKTTNALKDIEGDYKIIQFSIKSINNLVKKGDIVVSMLPGNFHFDIAKLCLSLGAHFVSSSYISDQMKTLNEEALEKNICLVNEVGLDPGIDHSMSHALVDDYKNSKIFSKYNEHYFLSYCGGLSDVPNNFCYKFSWSPLGVLKALMSPSISIHEGKKYYVKKPWNAVQLYKLPMTWDKGEFEVYPNRDSIPFISQYKLNEGINIKQFVRGTLRYKGWKKSWKDIFSEIDSLKPNNRENSLKFLSEKLWNLYSYKSNEFDRVVLTVELKVKKEKKIIWHKQFLLDTIGNKDGTAMAQLVSNSVRLATESIIKGEIEPGVTAAPDQKDLVRLWLNEAKKLSDHFMLIDHLK